LTVLTEDIGPGYCSVEDVRALGITADILAASYIEVLIARTADLMDSYLGGTFKLHEVQEWILSNHGTGRLIVSDYPIIELLGVKVRYALNEAPIELSIFDPQTGEGVIRYKGKSGIIERIDGGIFPEPPGATWLHYTAGYEPEDMPGILRDINARLAAAYSLMQIDGDINPQGLSSIGEGALSLSYGGNNQKAAALLEGWKEALSPIRRLSYGSL